MGSPLVTGRGTTANSPRSDTSHSNAKWGRGMWPQYGVGKPFRPLLSPLYHLRRSLLPDCTGKADFASAGELTFAKSGPYILRIRHAAASVRRRVFEAPH